MPARPRKTEPAAHYGKTAIKKRIAEQARRAGPVSVAQGVHPSLRLSLRSAMCRRAQFLDVLRQRMPCAILSAPAGPLPLAAALCTAARADVQAVAVSPNDRLPPYTDARSSMESSSGPARKAAWLVVLGVASSS